MSKKTLFNTLKSSLEEGIAYHEGKRRLRTFHIPEPAPVYTPDQIKRIRSSLRISQPVFALILNVSGKIVKRWE